MKSLSYFNQSPTHTPPLFIYLFELRSKQNCTQNCLRQFATLSHVSIYVCSFVCASVIRYIIFRKYNVGSLCNVSVILLILSIVCQNIM